MRYAVRFLVMSSVFAALVSPINAQFFLDDFGDGSDTDGMPVTWRQGVVSAGARRVENGNLEITTSGLSAAIIDELLQNHIPDVAIRTRIRMDRADSSNAVTAVTARSPGHRGAWVAIDALGNLAAGITISANQAVWDQVPTDFDPLAHDVILELAAFDELIEARAWRVGQKRPEVAQVQYADPFDPAGTVGVWMDSRGGLLTVSHRWFAALPGLSGADFDLDADVDHDDLNAWASAFGTHLDAMPTGGDADGDTLVDGADFLVWQRDHGTGVGGVSQAEAVPELGAFGMSIVGSMAFGMLRKRGRSPGAASAI